VYVKRIITAMQNFNDAILKDKIADDELR
jgi:hypothetical protein